MLDVAVDFGGGGRRTAEEGLLPLSLVLAGVGEVEAEVFTSPFFSTTEASLGAVVLALLAAPTTADVCELCDCIDRLVAVPLRVVFAEGGAPAVFGGT